MNDDLSTRQPPPIPEPSGLLQDPRSQPVGFLPWLLLAVVCGVIYVLARRFSPAIAFMLSVGSAIGVGIDAKKIGVKRGQIRGWFDASISLWVIGNLIAWALVFPAYLLARPAYLRANGKL